MTVEELNKKFKDTWVKYTNGIRDGKPIDYIYFFIRDVKGPTELDEDVFYCYGDRYLSPQWSDGVLPRLVYYVTDFMRLDESMIVSQDEVREQFKQDLIKVDTWMTNICKRFLV